MNKFLYSILLVFSSFSVYAQSKDSIGEIQTLVQRVDSLEHELPYLKWTYELKVLILDIKMFANDVYTQYIALKLDTYNKNYDIDLYDAYKGNYEAYEYRMQALLESIEYTKDLFWLDINTYNFTKSEQDLLMSSYRLIDYSYNSLKSSIDLFKIGVDVYKRCL